MKKSFINCYFARFISSVAGITSLTLFLLTPYSCKMTEEGLEIQAADMIPPSVASFDVLNSKVLKLSFSERFMLSNLSVFPELSDEEVSETEAKNIDFDLAYDESGTGATISLSESTSIGKSYILKGIVFDSSGNTLEFSRKFTGFNDNPARLILSEIKTASSKPSPEFIEVYVLKDGNTAGIELLSGNYGEDKKYVFPAIDVKAGEYITVHLRKYEEESDLIVDETGTDVDLAAASDCCATARDLWADDASKRVKFKDIVAIKNLDGSIMDIVLFSQSTDTSDWKTDLMKELSQKAVAMGLWTTGTSADENSYADGLSDSATTRSLSRLNVSEIAKRYATDVPDVIPVGKFDWIVTKKVGNAPGVTPGLPNSTNQYTSTK